MGNFFSDVGGALFGSGGTTGEIKQLETMTPEQKALFNSLLGTASQGGATTSAPFQTYSDTNQYEQQYMDLASGKTPSIAHDALLRVLSGQPAYDINPEATQSYYENSIRDPMVKEFNKTTLPGLNEQFAGPGFWSSNRAGAITDAYGNLNSSLNNQYGQLQMADEQARRTALQNAMNLQAQVAPGVDQAQITNAGNAGVLARSIESEKIASQMARWLSGESIDGQNVQAYNPNTQLAMALMGVQPYTYAQQNTTTGKGLLNSLLGGINIGSLTSGGSKE